MASRSRSGFSLIEMLIATAIVLVAVGVLSELADVGQRHAAAAEDAATAQRICQNLLEEMLCGSAPLEATSEAVVAEEPDWTYSVEVKPLEQYSWAPGLAEVRVTVAKVSEGASPGRSFSLTRWVRNSSGEKGEGKSATGADAGTDLGPDLDTDAGAVGTGNGVGAGMSAGTDRPPAMPSTRIRSGGLRP